MTLPINPAVPSPTNAPYQDQPDMQQNFANIVAFLSRNHTAPGSQNAGTHQIIEYLNATNPPNQTNPSSVSNTRNGIADSSIVELFYQNSRVETGTAGIAQPFPLSAIKAFGLFNGTNSGVITPDLGINIRSITKNSTNNYSVLLNSNSVSGSNFLVIGSCARPTNNNAVATFNYSITGNGQFNIVIAANSVADSPSISFVVIQI